MTDLTNSPIDRQNILNNQGVMSSLQEYLGLEGMMFKDEFRFTRSAVASFYGIDVSTIERYLASHEKELKHNGYVNLKGRALSEFKDQFGWMLVEGSKAPQLGVFNFRSVLNLGMLLTESEKAKAVRSAVLDIVISSLHQKVGTSTKLINQRDSEFLGAIMREPQYRKTFTSALSRYVEMGAYKYSYYTDAIYKAIFRENAAEYKKILKLRDEENPRDTMYAEVLKIIASFEVGIADEIKKDYDIKGAKLSPEEVNGIIEYFSTQNFWEPLLEDVRTKMASRDYGFRDAVHEQLSGYIKTLPPEDYERFLGEGSMELKKRIEENLDVFTRLRDK